MKYTTSQQELLFHSKLCYILQLLQTSKHCFTYRSQPLEALSNLNSKLIRKNSTGTRGGGSKLSYRLYRYVRPQPGFSWNTPRENLKQQAVQCVHLDLHVSGTLWNISKPFLTETSTRNNEILGCKRKRR